MPVIGAIRTLNSSRKALKPTMLVVGGTSGIGQYTALKIAEYTSAEKIIISGRNKKAGDEIVSTLNNLTKHTNNEFVACDVTLMKNIHEFTEQIKNKIQKLNYLVLSAGFLTTKGRDETEEGIDKKLACNFYSRFLLIKELMPLLENAAKDGEESRVLTILAAGKEGEIYEDDLDLKKNYGLLTAANVATTYNSLMVEEFAKLHPTVGFSHIYPGLVDTPITSNLPWYIRYPSKLFSFMATSQEDCGEIMTYALTNEKYKSGWHLLSEKGDELEPSKYQTRKNIDLMWKHAEELTRIN
jgi:NAD(P)-dependent dehydrogenase (short-subunit alcohol dehydrogenase family)